MPIAFHSVAQKIVTLPMTEPKIAADMMVTQDMLYVYSLLESSRLTLKLPMLLEMDNSGAVGIVNSWSISGCTCHVVSTQVERSRAVDPDMSQGCSSGYKPKTGSKMDPKEIHFKTEEV